MKRRPARRSAFTILEVLISLVVVSTVALSLYSSLRIAFKARRSALAAIEPIQAAEAAMACLERDLESALPPTGLLAGDFLGEDATGENGLESDILGFHTCSGVSDIEYPDSSLDDEFVLSLLGNNVPRQTGGDIQQVEYMLVRDEEGTDFVLVRNVTKNLLAQTTPEPMEQVLCRNVLSFNVSYLDGTELLESWDSTQQEDAVPVAVEVTLEVRCVEPEEASNPQSRNVLDALGALDQRSRRVTSVFLLPCSAPATEEEENQYIR
jgi:hypothetical protein